MAVTVEDSMEAFEKDFSRTQNLRGELLDIAMGKARDVARKRAGEDDGGSPRQVEVDNSCIKLAAEMLDGLDKANSSRVKMYLQQKSDDSNADFGAQAIEMLKRIGHSAPVTNVGQTQSNLDHDAELEAAYKEGLDDGSIKAATDAEGEKIDQLAVERLEKPGSMSEED